MNMYEQFQIFNSPNYRRITEPTKFVNEETKTKMVVYPKSMDGIEAMSLLLDLDSDCDGYIVCYPYGNPNLPFVAEYQGKYINVTIDEDCYQFELYRILLVGDIAEIMSDTYDESIVREYLLKYQYVNKIK